jgi:hypothetical protein
LGELYFTVTVFNIRIGAGHYGARPPGCGYTKDCSISIKQLNNTERRIFQCNSNTMCRIYDDEKLET